MDDRNDFEYYNDLCYLGSDNNHYLVLVKPKYSYHYDNYVINENTKIIYDSTFEGQTGLTSVTIPDSVTSIGYYAFSCCTKLKTINYTGTEEQWKAIRKDSNWDKSTGNYTIKYNYTGE